MCGMVGFEVIKSPLREWEGAARAASGGRGGDWDLGGAVPHGRRAFQSPLREWEGAASCPADLAPELAEGRGRTGASGGRGGEGVAGMHMAQNESGRNAPPFFARHEQKGGQRGGR